MEPKPKNEDSSWVYWVIGVFLTLFVVVVILMTGIFLIRKKRTGTLAFIDDDMQVPSGNESRNPESLNENTNTNPFAGEHGNLENNAMENNARQRFGNGFFSIYCRACYGMIERRNTQSLKLNCLRENSENEDEQGILQSEEGREETFFGLFHDQ